MTRKKGGIGAIGSASAFFLRPRELMVAIYGERWREARLEDLEILRKDRGRLKTGGGVVDRYHVRHPDIGSELMVEVRRFRVDREALAPFPDEDGGAARGAASFGVPILSMMPDGLLENTLLFLEGDEGFLPTLLSLQRTCKALCRVIRENPNYECDRNSFVGVFGGHAIRRVVEEWIIDEALASAIWWYFRGDSLAYITLSVQHHILSKLKKAHRAARHRWRVGEPEPTVHTSDLRLVDEMMEDNWTHMVATVKDQNMYGVWDGCLSERDGKAHPWGAEERRCFVCELAYQAGVTRMSDEAVAKILNESMDCMAAMIVGVIQLFRGSDDMWEDVTPDEIETRKLEFGDFRMKYPPPRQGELGDEDSVTLVPGQVKSYAKAMGLKLLFGYEQLGQDDWVTSRGRTREEEIQEAKIAYRGLNLFDGIEDESMSGAIESDGAIVDESDLDSESEGSHELGEGFLEDYD